MEADWCETTRITLPGSAPNAPPSEICTFAFDPSQELLWTGNDAGRVTSFYDHDLQRYSSYRGHVGNSSRAAPDSAPVRQLLFCEKGVISISGRSVHLANRRAVTQWHLEHPDMQDLQCMCFTSRDTDELIATGARALIFRINVDKGSIIETVTLPQPGQYTMMRLCGQQICAAKNNGSIDILDPKTLSVIHGWKAYAGPVSDMDARGDYLVTCGWVQTQHKGLALERLVRVFNLRTRTSIAPLSFPTGAACVRMHPKLSSTCVILSQSGLLHSVDILNPDMPTMRYANAYDGASYTGLELMPSGKGFALSISNCHIVLWGPQNTKLQFTEFPQPTEFADHVAPHKHLDWSNDTPLNLIGMPYYRETLLSVWPNSLLHTVGQSPPRYDINDPTLRPFEYGKVGPNPKKERRYQAPEIRLIQKSADALAAPKFLSEKPREDENTHASDRRMSEDLIKALDRAKIEGTSLSDAKFLYRKVEIQYSRFGIEDFDFGYFNKTKYAGLETHIVNSYANPLLQILRFTPVARNLALHHTARDCRLEDCLLCELGFLVDMLEKAKTPNCQATNFLKALSRQHDALGQNILESTPGNSLTAMMQNLNRYILQRLEDNFRSVAPSLDAFQLAFGTIGLDYTQCAHCNYQSSMDKVWYTHDLLYPSKTAKHRTAVNFSQIMKSSIERYNHHRGWCLRCNGYKPLVSHRAIHCLPATLMLNAAVTTPEAKQLWATPGFLPKEIGVIVNNGRFFCYEGQDLQLHIQRGHFAIKVYELVGVVADVKTGDNAKPHLVATIDTGITSPDPRNKGNWHLFNDFLVHKLPADDVLHFNPQWKLPSVVTYLAKSWSHRIDDTWKTAIDTSVLYRSPMQPALTPTYRFRALGKVEPLPNSQSHVGIDAEFVRLLREEIDVGADGSRTMTRPARSGLARVSVLRGDGHDEQLPFIDDYIAIEEPIDDYLTQFSGLQSGDLTAGVSRFKLVTLKEVYRKLWVLLNLGVTFVGHGLSSDFRIINIHVPESQVIDTQDLFSLGERGRRKLSLRFLAWFVLKEEVQKPSAANANPESGIIGHDSIEDARTAIKLWKKFQEFKDAGILEAVMDEVWAKGRATDFKVPSDYLSAKEKRGVETPIGSAPGTPMRQPIRIATPGKGAGEFGSPHMTR